MGGQQKVTTDNDLHVCDRCDLFVALTCFSLMIR